MKLTQVKGSTWVLEANELIPLYLLDDRRCVLLDSGLAKEREEIEKTLLEAGLEPAGILCSHAHVDHCANNRYFQEKYHLPVALTAPEAGMCSSILNLKCYRLLVSPDAAEQEMSEMVHVPDLILPPVDGPIRLAGAMFRILHTPGHSSVHICAVTPDNVCYTVDALMYHALLDGASWHRLDNYFLLLDFPSYVDTKLKAIYATKDRENFARMCLENVASAGKFSSDRTIRQYATEIWHV